jgi:hypothetical protein
MLACFVQLDKCPKSSQKGVKTERGIHYSFAFLGEKCLMTKLGMAFVS